MKESEQKNQKKDLSNFFLFYLEQEKEIYNESTVFLCVIQGAVSLDYRAFSGELRQGDLILLKEVGKYVLNCRGRSLILIVSFDYIFFTEQFGEDFERLDCNSAASPGPSSDAVREAVIRLALSHVSDRRENRFLIRNQIFHLFHLLKTDFLAEAEPDGETGGRSAKQALRLKQFTSFLEANYTSPLTLQDAADYMGYTPQYLSNFIRKNLGCTFNSRLNSLRLKAAVNYLKFRDLSIEQISLRCGFPNAASFQRVFRKEYLTTPEQFREDYRSVVRNDPEGVDMVTDPSLIRDCLQACVRTAGEASLSAIEHVVQDRCSCSAAETAPLHPVWKELINLGSASNFLNPTFRMHIAMIQRELRFRYGRITDILSVVNVYHADDRGYIFNFSQVFTFLDFCLDLGLKPLLELGDKSPDIYLPGGQVRIENSDLDDVCRALIPALIRSCADHYGFDEVSSWKFEFWMRYGNSTMTRIESPQAYFERFRHVYRSIKAILPYAEVGAPGFNTFASMDHLEKVLALFDRHGLIPDFITAYIYPFAMPDTYEDEDDLPVRLQEDPGFFRQQASAIRKLCARYHMEQVPLYITEFSTHIAFANYFNDSTFQAAFLVRQYLDNWRETAAMGYWLASDYSVEYPDSTQFLFGGNGIVSQHGIPKPGFHAFRFLSSLGCDLLAQGEHYIVTHSIDDRYQVLIHNYAHFTADFCRHPDRYDPLKYPDAAIEDVPPFQLTLRIRDLPAGTYKVSRRLLDSRHGSVFHEWRKLNFLECLDETELDYFKNICVPDLFVCTAEVTDSLTLSEKIEKNEICLFLIEKIS